MKQPLHPSSTVSRETREKLDAYIALVRTWTNTINLIAPGDEPFLESRHLADSLALLEFLPPHFDRAIDMGSGAGFPGLVLALATGRQFDLVESDKRKCAFLREAVRLTDAPVTVHATRIEQLHLRQAPLITARALAPLSKLLTWAEPLLAPSGCCIFPKGRSAEDELTQAARQWHMRVEQWPSPVQPDASILRISEISRV